MASKKQEILQRVLAIDNTRSRSNKIDDIKKLVESAIKFPRLRETPGAAIGKRKCPECQKLRRAKREWIYSLVLAPLAFVVAFAILLPIAIVGGFVIIIWTHFADAEAPQTFLD